MASWSKVKVGDTIKFKTWNRDGTKTATRKVVSINPVEVRMFGWSNFRLGRRGDKLISIIQNNKYNGKHKRLS